MSRVRLRDVADRAGVALSTASAALNGSPRVAEATRARVMDAAQVLDYKGPDPWARALRTRQPMTMCLIIDEGLLGKDPAALLPLVVSATDAIARHDSFVLFISSSGARRTQQVRHAPAAAAIIIGRASVSLLADLAHRSMASTELPLETARDHVDRLVDDFFASRRVAK